MIEDSDSCSSGELYREGERTPTQKVKDVVNEVVEENPYEDIIIPGANIHHKQK